MPACCSIPRLLRAGALVFAAIACHRDGRAATFAPPVLLDPAPTPGAGETMIACHPDPLGSVVYSASATTGSKSRVYRMDESGQAASIDSSSDVLTELALGRDGRPWMACRRYAGVFLGSQQWLDNYSYVKFWSGRIPTSGDASAWGDNYWCMDYSVRSYMYGGCFILRGGDFGAVNSVDCDRMWWGSECEPACPIAPGTTLYAAQPSAESHVISADQREVGIGPIEGGDGWMAVAVDTTQALVTRVTGRPFSQAPAGTWTGGSLGTVTATGQTSDGTILILGCRGGFYAVELDPVTQLGGRQTLLQASGVGLEASVPPIDASHFAPDGTWHAAYVISATDTYLIDRLAPEQWQVLHPTADPIDGFRLSDMHWDSAAVEPRFVALGTRAGETGVYFFEWAERRWVATPVAAPADGITFSSPRLGKSHRWGDCVMFGRSTTLDPTTRYYVSSLGPVPAGWELH